MLAPAMARSTGQLTSNAGSACALDPHSTVDTTNVVVGQHLTMLIIAQMYPVAPFFVLLALTLASTSPAFAYTYDSPVGNGCHESITTLGLRKVRAEWPTAAPLPTSAKDQLVIDDLVFTPANDMMDIGSVTLLIGVRDNDLKGHSGIDTQQLAGIHGSNDTQREHCLRRLGHDEPGGSESALAECRDFVRNRFMAAIEQGLDANGHVDTTRRTEVDVQLAFRGRVTVPLPTFYVRMGQALHTLQDSFSHVFRTSDHLRVTVVMNWVDQVEGGHDSARDGPAHMRELDLCTNLDDFRRARLTTVRQATEALLRAALDPALTLAEKRAAGDQVLTTYMSYEPGCTFGNDWCDAPENAYADSSCLCSSPGSHAPATSWGWLLGLTACVLLLRRRAIAITALLLWPAGANADESEPANTGFAAHSAFSASVDNGAFAWAVGGRYAITNCWIVGIDAEYNPWFSLEAGRFARGAFNGYATAIYRHDIGHGLALRATGNLGTSVLLFDLVGAPKGSVGPFVGLNILGLSYELDDHVYLLVDPAHVVVPVPQIHGAPFSYHQYRITVGVQLGA